MNRYVAGSPSRETVGNGRVEEQLQIWDMTFGECLPWGGRRRTWGEIAQEEGNLEMPKGLEGTKEGVVVYSINLWRGQEKEQTWCICLWVCGQPRVLWAISCQDSYLVPELTVYQQGNPFADNFTDKTCWAWECMMERSHSLESLWSNTWSLLAPFPTP